MHTNFIFSHMFSKYLVSSSVSSSVLDRHQSAVASGKRIFGKLSNEIRLGIKKQSPVFILVLLSILFTIAKLWVDLPLITCTPCFSPRLAMFAPSPFVVVIHGIGCLLLGSHARGWVRVLGVIRCGPTLNLQSLMLAYVGHHSIVPRSSIG